MDFGTALKDWRTRRRLSQLDLALRAGTTQRHVSFMESGRSVPGRGMVLRVAESLELPLRERNGLLHAAGYAPTYPETRLDDPAIRPVLDGLRRLLDGHRPYPAIVVDRYGLLVAKNDAFSLLIEGVAPELLEEPVDTLRLALHPAGWRRACATSTTGPGTSSSASATTSPAPPTTASPRSSPS